MILAQQIDAYMRKKKSPLYGQGKTFVKTAKKYGLDPLLLPAIAGAESSFGTAGSEGNFNPFGWGPHIPFDSWRQSIRQVGKGLSEGYVKQGLDTIPEIQQKWAPVGASNDPTALNRNWIGNVSQYYNELERRTGRKPKFPGMKKGYIPGMSELIHDPIGSWFSGNYSAGPYGGHESHVHLAGDNPRLLLNSIRLANRLGLRVGENPYTDRVDPVHTGQSARYGDYTGSGSPSEHYKLFPGRYGPQDKKLGAAIDVSGDPAAMARFFQNRLLRAGKQYVPVGGGYVPGGAGAGVYGDPTSNRVRDRNTAEWNVAEMNRANAVFGAAAEAAEGGSPLARRRRKRRPYVEQLIDNLLQGGA